MRIIRAIVFAIFLWLLVFFELSALRFSFGIKYPSDIYFLVFFGFFILFSVMCTLGYFFAKKMRRGVLHGLIVGLIFAVLMAILHMIVIVPFVMENVGFVYRLDTLVSYLIVIVVGMMVGVSRR